jgi:hypothetical protein
MHTRPWVCMIYMEKINTISETMLGRIHVMSGRRSFLAALLVLLLVIAAIPSTALAYSYGNPNEEAVAENYKQVVAKLNQQPPDFAGAKDAFKPIQEELDMHMGKEPAQAILKALDDKDKAAAIDAYQKTLVLNVARRLESIVKDFNNYEQNKLLLAKSLATYEALSPVVKAKDPAVDEKIRASFDKALESLGNPGLFGVGVKPADQPAFVAQKDTILKTLQEQFKLESLEVGHFTAGDSTHESAGKNKQTGGIGELRNWIPIALIVLVIGFIVFRTMRKRRG